MKLMPDDKSKAIVYGVIIAVAALVAIYFLWPRSGEPTLPTELQERTEAINSSVKSAPPTQELPAESRPLRGPPVGPP
jgi:hypothetical protein